MSAPGEEIAGDECAVMSQPMMSCPFTGSPKKADAWFKKKYETRDVFVE